MRQAGRVTGGGTRYAFEAELWRWASRTDEWVFARLPLEASDEIAEVPRLRVTLGGSRWTTSIFPEPRGTDGAYVLPVKRSVRTAEGVGLGDVVRLAVEVLE